MPFQRLFFYLLPLFFTISLFPVETVFVKGGLFLLGSNEEAVSSPAHKVTVSDFYIGKYEITAAQFKQFVDETAYTTDAEKQGKVYCWTNKNPDNKWQWTIVDGVFWQYDIHGVLLKNYTHPVIHVSWNEILKNEVKVACKQAHRMGYSEICFRIARGRTRERRACNGPCTI